MTARDSLNGEQFSNIYIRIHKLTGVNLSLWMIGKWAEAAAGQAFDGLVARMVPLATASYPAQLAGIPQAELIPKMRAASQQMHSDGVAVATAATLIFSHTVTDSAVDELIEISSLGLSSRWRFDELEVKTTVAQLRDLGAEECIRRAQSRRVAQEKQKSLPNKLKFLFSIAKRGPAEFGQSFDFDLVSAADEARHRIIHESALTERLEAVDQMIGANLSASLGATLAVARSCGFELCNEPSLGAFVRIEQPQETGE